MAEQFQEQGGFATMDPSPLFRWLSSRIVGRVCSAANRVYRGDEDMNDKTVRLRWLPWTSALFVVIVVVFVVWWWWPCFWSTVTTVFIVRHADKAGPTTDALHDPPVRLDPPVLPSLFRPRLAQLSLQPAGEQPAQRGPLLSSSLLRFDEQIVGKIDGRLHGSHITVKTSLWLTRI